MSVNLDGAADLHCHFGPDPHFARSVDAYEAAGPTAAGTCPTEALVLPLDHGLRALTTPQQNRLRMERYEAKLKACKNAAK